MFTTLIRLVVLACERFLCSTRQASSFHYKGQTRLSTHIERQTRQRETHTQRKTEREREGEGGTNRQTNNRETDRDRQTD